MMDHRVTTPTAGQCFPAFVVPLDGTFRIEFRPLQRTATSESVVSVEVFQGSDRIAGGLLGVPFIERWADVLTGLAAELAMPAGFPRWTSDLDTAAPADPHPTTSSVHPMRQQMALAGR